MKSVIFLIILFLNIFASDFYYEYGKKVELKKIDKTRNLQDSDITYYKNEYGQIVGVKNEIIIKCKSNQICKTLFKKYGLLNVNKLSDRFFHIILTKDQDVFLLSSKLYYEDGVLLSHPNFVKKRFKR